MCEVRVFRSNRSSFLKYFCVLSVIVFFSGVVSTLIASFAFYISMLMVLAAFAILFLAIIVTFSLVRIIYAGLVVRLDDSGITKETRWSKENVTWDEIARFRTGRSLPSDGILIIGHDGKRKMVIPQFVNVKAILAVIADQLRTLRTDKKVTSSDLT